MNYKGQEFKYFSDVFEYALNLAKNKKKKEVQEFREAYVNYILEDADDIHTKEEAEARMISNFGYYAGYYSDDVRRLMNKYYGAVHPIFGNYYNVTSEEAYELGQRVGRGEKNVKLVRS